METAVVEEVAKEVEQMLDQEAHGLWQMAASEELRRVYGGGNSSGGGENSNGSGRTGRGEAQAGGHRHGRCGSGGDPHNQ